MSELPQDIKDIEARIREIKEDNKKAENKPKSQAGVFWQQAFRFATEFVSPVIIALVLGYWADDFFSTKPIIMLVMLVFGGAAGILNTYRAAKEIDKDL